jgi:hypothetical protein
MSVDACDDHEVDVTDTVSHVDVGLLDLCAV